MKLCNFSIYKVYLHDYIFIMAIEVKIGAGELMDKISILAIKLDRIKDISKITNIKVEYRELLLIFSNLNFDEKTLKLYHKLYDVNTELWDIEDSLRELEREKIFDENFISLARKVYFTNDKRAEIKKDINLSSGSEIIEEKSYEKY